MSEAVSLRGVALPAAAVATKPRWLTLDLLRFVAVVLMIQGHVFYEVVSDAVRAQPWYSWHGYVHGFTAPIFLFSSGVAFGITTLGKWDDHTQFGPAVFKRFERYAILMGLGYLLQFGGIGLRGLFALSPERLEFVTLVNALQMIALVLAVAEGLVLLTKNRRAFLSLIAVLLVVVVSVAPWTHNLTLSSWPIPLRAWVTYESRSLFPIFPWAGFLLAGILFAEFIRARRKAAAAGLMQLVVPFFVIAALLIVAGKYIAIPGLPEHDHWKAGPMFFVFRLGIVSAVLGVLSLIDLGISKRPALSRSGPILVLQRLGAETLVVYVTHLLMIYGFLGLPGLKEIYPRSLDLAPAIALVVAVFAAMVAFAWAWHEAKTQRASTFNRVRYVLTVVLLIAFVLAPI